MQLPGFMAAQKNPSETGGWPLIREEMLKNPGLRQHGHGGHHQRRRRKEYPSEEQKAVGYRLAQWALAKTYEKKVPASGPLYASINSYVYQRDGKILVHFDYAEGGLVAKGGKLKSFVVAGDDKIFVWADATIDGQSVVVSSDKVKQPVAVRYAWANNPDCNLTNKAGLPASPFRSDDWEN